MKPDFGNLFRSRSPWITILGAGFLWTALVVGFAVLGDYYSRQEILQVALDLAKNSFQKDLSYRLWAMERGGIYVPLDEKTPPNPYLKDIPNREIRADDGKTYTLVNPAYMTRMVHELAAKEYGLQGHITSLNPIRPENAPDPWERAALLRFEQGSRDHWERVVQDGAPYLRYMGAFLVQPGCLKCHASQGYKVGDVRGGISVSVPLSSSESGAPQDHWRVTSLSLAFLWILGLGAIGFWAFRTARLEQARLEALSSLEESRSLYQSLAEDIPASLFRRDLEDRLVYANPPMLSDLGEAMNAYGLRPQDCHPPDEAEVIAQEDRQVLSGNTLRLVRPYRSPSTGEEQVREVVKSPVRNRAGEIVGLQGISWDVTERVRKDEAIRRHLEQYQAVIQTAADGFLRIGIDGGIQEVNDAYCAISGYSRDELIGRPIHDLVANESAAELQACFKRVRSEGSSVFQMQHRAKDGRLVEFEISLTFVPSMNFCVLFLRDVTERLLAAAEKQRLEAEVLHMQKLDSLGRLAGGVAHDMNNILAAIMALGSVLAMKHKTDPGIQKDTADLLNAARRGRDLVKGLTQFARKELSESVPQDLNQIVRQEAELLARTTLKAVEVVLDIDESLGKVRGDANVLSNALMNLCVNALDAMAGKGRLRLATRNLPPDQVELVVEDNGEGMSPDTLARAMEPFFTTKPVGKGTGLGLAMVYGAVKSHGGTLELQSELGRGTRVIIHLPSTDSPVAARSPETLAVPVSLSLAVLLVDDDELVLATLPLMLEGQGHRVTTASSGAEALRKLQEGLEVQLLILDMNMPGMDGLETLARIRMFRPQLQVLLATGNGGDPKIEGVLSRDGRTALLLKPFSFDELRQKLATFLA